MRRLVAPALAAFLASATACSLFADFGGLSAGSTAGSADVSPLADGSPSADASLLIDASTLDASLDSPDASPPTEGLIGYWSFDEGSGTVAHDSSPNGLDATVSGAVWTTGKVGGALKFDGVQSYVETLGRSPPIGGRYTMALWVRLDATVIGTPWVLVKSSSATLALRVHPGTWQFAWNDTTTTTDELVAPRANEPGVWHHVAVTHDGTTARLFVDHALATSKVQTTQNYDAKRFNIGADARFSTSYTTGALDEVRLYDRDLSPDEIARL